MEKDLNLNAYNAKQLLLASRDYLTDIANQTFRVEKANDANELTDELYMLQYATKQSIEKIMTLVSYAIEEMATICNEDTEQNQ